MSQAHSQSFFSGLKYDARFGYNIGGTAPLGMPASIRKLNSYNPQLHFSIGIDAVKPLSGPWALLVGLNMENKGMKTDATVKSYHMSITRGGETLEGAFTGRVSTTVHLGMFTVPVQAVYSFNDNVRLKFGPYASMLISRDFQGSAYNGYLRVGNPTGAKVELGSDESSRGTYDFSDHIRTFEYGLDLGAEWFPWHTFGVYGDLSWGLTGLFNSSFKTVEQTLYPIYGTIGMIYRIK